jgi:hypothetical protein
VNRINLDLKKLLGFKIIAIQSCNIKALKLGSKIGTIKIGSKIGTPKSNKSK